MSEVKPAVRMSSSFAWESNWNDGLSWDTDSHGNTGGTYYPAPTVVLPLFEPDRDSGDVARIEFRVLVDPRWVGDAPDARVVLRGNLPELDVPLERHPLHPMVWVTHVVLPIPPGTEHKGGVFSFQCAITDGDGDALVFEGQSAYAAA